MKNWVNVESKKSICGLGRGGGVGGFFRKIVTEASRGGGLGDAQT